MGENRGSISFFTTYRPEVPLDIFSCPVAATSKKEEFRMTDGLSHNYNGQVIPPAALKTILNRPELASEAREEDVDSNLITGCIFVSERENNLETLHIALRFHGKPPKSKVFSLADIYGADSFNGVRLEDSGCFGGGYKLGSRTIDHFLVYVSTKEPVQKRRCPWTVVYKTNLRTGETERLTPPGIFDLSPSASPSGKKIAVASFQGKAWDGEIEDLQTNIYVMNLDESHSSLERKKVIVNGGWPTWGSENVLFFHRKEYYGASFSSWRVFRFDISTGETIPVTPKEFDAVTPAAISETKVAVATIRMKLEFPSVRVEAQYRHIEIFDITAPGQSVPITQKITPKTDHLNPFVIDGGKLIGYHRCNIGRCQKKDDILKHFHKVQSPIQDVGLLRVSGVLPTISTFGFKLAFVDDFKDVWLSDRQGLRIVYKVNGSDNISAPIWNPNPDMDILYVCKGNPFRADEPSEICAICNVSHPLVQFRQLTKGKFNNGCPSPDSSGKRLVFGSTRDWGEKKHKNLYIMEDTEFGEFGEGKITRLTEGPWTDTHCQWSPNGDWIVFSSTRDKPKDAPDSDNGHDPGYFAIFLVNSRDPTVVVRVMKSAYNLAGHVNHPVFSPDGKSIAVAADFAGVSADPISLPFFMHSVRPYGDIFTVDIDPDDINKNKDVKTFHRITHCRYENGLPIWTRFSTDDPNAQWILFIGDSRTPFCPC